MKTRTEAAQHSTSLTANIWDYLEVTIEFGSVHNCIFTENSVFAFWSRQHILE